MSLAFRLFAIAGAVAVVTPAPAQVITEKALSATAALTMPHHNGRTEGVNTKTKMIQRQMYGRAGFSLLRLRVLNHC